jgi:hypothetical protein
MLLVATVSKFVVRLNVVALPMVTARRVPCDVEEVERCRPSQPERTLAGAARSQSMLSSKWERARPGTPDPTTGASSPAFHIGCRAARFLFMPNRSSRAKVFSGRTPIFGRAA